ncbi:hypothetical protein FRC20_008950 [Serendipita sp. 405]|nr:hypothetical protein FRC20_008950 [Serendipita sp. 405]
MDSKLTSTSYNQQPLLKTSQPTYESSTSNGRAQSSAEAGRRDLAATQPPPEGPSMVKRFLATFAIVLSGGAKLAHVAIHIWRKEPDTNWYKPVDGMLIIFWIGVYALQLDFVYMLGHAATDDDPAAYTKMREIAHKNLPKFLVAHFLLMLWQIFLIVKLPICALISITLAFIVLCKMYISIHKLWKDHTIYRSDASNSPSFLQGPTSALLVFAAIVHIPSTLIILITHYKPHANLDAIEWPLAWWILIINVAGSHIATRRAYVSARASQVNSQLQVQIAARNGEDTSSLHSREQRSVPVDLAAVISLFWGSLAIAAGTGTVNHGPVSPLSYISALWQALALFGPLVD